MAKYGRFTGGTHFKGVSQSKVKVGKMCSIEQRRELYKLGCVIKYGSNITYKEAEALLLSLRKHKDD
jgi:hypothetical protein